MISEKVTAAAAQLVRARNPKLDLIAIGLAFGITFPGINCQTDAARVLGLTRAAVNKRVMHWREFFDVISMQSRSEQTRARCAQSQILNHWRRRGRKDGVR